MIKRLPVTVLIAARNEASNMPKCLRSLAPAERILVIDSSSSDATASIAENAGAEVLQFHYQGTYPKKRQWALENAGITTPWVFMVDADEEVPDVLWKEIGEVIADEPSVNAFLIVKGFHFMGRRLRWGGFSHGAVLLFRNGKARFEETLAESASNLDMEVHERVIVEGPVGSLSTPLIHNDYKGLHAYIDRHNRYSSWEAELRYRYLNTGTYGSHAVRARFWGNTQEFRRFIKAFLVRFPLEPLVWFIYHYVYRLGLLEGHRGLIASRIRANYICDVRAKVHERMLAVEGSVQTGSPGRQSEPNKQELTRDN